jgi:hypothetical protein
MEVRPKTIVDRIDAYWEFPAQEQERPLPQSPVLDSSNAAKIHALYGLCQKVDATLLPPGNNRALYDEALGAMDMALQRWRQNDKQHPLGGIKVGDRWMNAVSAVRMLLSECPNEPVAAVAADLPFIVDKDAQADLARDIEDTRWAVENHRWKPATVVAGASIEALLLSALAQTPEAQRHAAVASITAKKRWKSPPPKCLDAWTLFQYLLVSEELGLIRADTATQAMLAKDFRNLIHPGLVKSEDRRCSEATALGARAGVLMVIEDLGKTFPT